MKLRKNLIISIIFMMVTSMPVSAAWQWTDYMGIASNYIHPTSQGSMDRILVLAMDVPFHACGWNAAANINSTILGEQTFDTLTGAFLSAWMGNKKVSLLIDGCDGSRARVYGIRISK
jgi:hypothetical protein